MFIFLIVLIYSKLFGLINLSVINGLKIPAYNPCNLFLGSKNPVYKIASNIGFPLDVDTSTT